MLLVATCVGPSSPIIVSLMKEALGSPKRRFLQEPHGVTSQKTPFFIVTALKTSNLTIKRECWNSGSIGLMQKYKENVIEIDMKTLMLVIHL
jgi:hypothetical protein